MNKTACHRRLGRTGPARFIVGLGGISLVGMEPAEAVALVNAAIDAGVQHLDVAPTYGDAQKKMGEVLKDRRKEVFLSCKTTARDAEGAKRELETSLRELQTDHIDLYQFHALDRFEDLEKVLQPEGALTTFLRARDEGVVRYLGVTGHHIETHQQTISKMNLDTVMAPLNFRTYHAMCGPEGLIAMARKRGMGVVAIKATTRGEIGPTADAYRFTLSQDVDITMPAEREFWAAYEVARRFTPMSTEEQQAFLRHCTASFDPSKLY